MRSVTITFHGLGDIPGSIPHAERPYWLNTHDFVQVIDAVSQQPKCRLTFDDGNCSDIEIAMPLLLARSLTAEFFVCSERIGTRGYLAADQIRHLQARGMTIGSHGAVHRPWKGLGEREIQEELYTSKSILEDVCGAPVSHAACPFGCYNRTTLRHLHHAGYTAVYTSDRGVTSPGSWLRPRYSLTADRPFQTLQAIMSESHSLLRLLSYRIRSAIKAGHYAFR